MSTVNDITDFVRIIREQPEWAETIRGILLSRELLELPQRLADYVAATDRRLERLETALANFVESTNQRLEALEAGQTVLQDGQARLEVRYAELAGGQQEIRADVSAIRSDLRPLKGAHARNGAERATRRIARIMNCFQVGLLNSDDLYRMLNAGDADDLPRSERDSFEDADIVIVAEHRDTSETHYIAVEASFTAHEEATQRAIRNAGYLTRFTGQPAHAVVASLFVDPDIEQTFDSGRVRWYEIERKHLEPD
jgi:hypothetical protein